MNGNKSIQWLLMVLSIGLFIAGMVATISMTVGVIDILLPGNPVMRLLAPIFFDIGFVLWAASSIWRSRSTEQRMSALLMAVVDLAGMSLMIAGNLYYGGQNLVSPPPGLARWIINGTVGVIVLNVVCFFYFEAHNPETIKATQEQLSENEQFEESMKRKGELLHIGMQQARQQFDREGHQLGQIIARRMVLSIKHDMDLSMTAAERKAFEKDVINAEVQDVDYKALPSPDMATPGIWQAIKSFFGGARAGARMNSSSHTTSLPQSSPDESE